MTKPTIADLIDDLYYTALDAQRAVTASDHDYLCGQASRLLRDIRLAGGPTSTVQRQRVADSLSLLGWHN
jgi:hypothetical protein